MTRILVVDDSEDARDITCAHLLAAGYGDIVTAGSGEAALAILRDGTADAVLLDVMMEGLDGIETCARIRGERRHADLPILMVTTLTDAESLAQAFVAGATDYITKPVRRMELSARLRSALRLKAELDRRRAREAALEAALGGQTPQALVETVTGLPGQRAFDAALATARPGCGVIALLIDGAAMAPDPARLAAVREATSAVVARVPAPLGALLADLGNGLFAVLVPPAADAADLGKALHGAIAAAGLPGGAGDLRGQITVSLGVARTGTDPRPAFVAAVAAAERASAAGGNRVQSA